MTVQGDEKQMMPTVRLSDDGDRHDESVHYSKRRRSQSVTYQPHQRVYPPLSIETVLHQKQRWRTFAVRLALALKDLRGQ
jgi:hypothetical protein